ncbi:uncharacterized protein LOC121804017 [Salvia splendens]|uniref:uncharacterized protein LOC121804017 n=1 Tax=Salvia splendens TaxID=180675 RepID=UPI001C265F5A|nr:uncharacterized protein LOC121804017 [Salvia splendens]
MQRDGVNNLHLEIVSDLQHMLDENNALVKSFRMAKEKIGHENQPNVSLRLLGKRGRDGRTYNLPSVSEVAVLVVGDFDEALGDRDIVVQFVVDAYTMIETGRLTFVRTHQKRFRAELYSGLAEVVLRGETDGSRHGKRIILPSSFVGGARYMVQNYQDAMAICRWIGIFKVKLDNLIRDLKSKKIFGAMKAVVYTVEFQKRGLPHAHILLFLSNEDKQPKPQRIDEIISAELPDQVADPHYYERRDNGRVVVKDGVPLDNRYVVPYNRYLLMKYGGHVNVEWCNQSQSIKYISSCEAAWRIFGFEIQYKDPPVERLSFHLPDQHVIFDEAADLDTVLNRKTIHESKFLAWMEANKIYSQGRDLTYGEFPTKLVWKKNHWEPRKQRYSIGRLFYVAPGCGDMYYLRCLLNIVKGASYEDIRCVNGIQYATFRDACFALGLLDDDKEYVHGIVEASFWASAHSLRLLYVSLLTSESISCPDFVWQSCWKQLSEDVLYSRRKLTNNPGLILSEDEIQNLALAEIEKLLQNLGKTLRDFHGLPYPDIQYFESCENRLIIDELCYDRDVLPSEYSECISKFTDEQLCVHDTIMSSVYSMMEEYFLFTGSALAELIVRAKLIIWDEAPMIHKHCIEAVDRTLRDIMRVSDQLNMNKPFGGKTVVFGGDFRQILLVVPKGSRQDVVNATINSSYLWKSCTVVRLTKNIRLTNFPLGLLLLAMVLLVVQMMGK